MSEVKIPYGRQCIEQEDIDAVTEVLQSNFLTQGPAVRSFESALAKAFNVDHVSVLNNATSALFVVYKALGLGPGDLLWTVPNTFVATSNAALVLGADVDFVDINLETFCLCVEDLEKKLVTARANDRVPKIVVPVHFGGQPCNLTRIHELSKEYGFSVVEDASHAVGATYGDQAIGNCSLSAAAVFSFHPVKIITTGEGGAIATNNSDLHTKITQLISHGITRDESLFESEKGLPWKYEQIDISLNFRMPDILAALGESQLGRLEANISRRREIARTYQAAFEGLPIGLQCAENMAESSWHLFVIQAKDKSERLKLFKYLRDRGIMVNVHYIPVHHQPHYKKLNMKFAECAKSVEYYDRAISLPMYHSLTEADLQTVINAVKNFYS